MSHLCIVTYLIHKHTLQHIVGRQWKSVHSYHMCFQPHSAACSTHSHPSLSLCGCEENMHTTLHHYKSHLVEYIYLFLNNPCAKNNDDKVHYTSTVVSVNLQCPCVNYNLTAIIYITRECIPHGKQSVILKLLPHVAVPDSTIKHT